MGDVIKIKLTKRAVGLLASVQALPSWGMDAICRGMDKANQVTLSHIQRAHLTGKGPFPVEEHRLGVVTNRLRSGAWATPAIHEATVVVTEIGDNVKYARLHEFGGTVHHEARTGTSRLKTNKRGELVRQQANAHLAVFAKAKHKNVKEVAWKSEAYDVKVPERAPFRTGIRESMEKYGRMVSRELVEAWKIANKDA